MKSQKKLIALYVRINGVEKRWTDPAVDPKAISTHQALGQKEKGGAK